jgi:putative membrane protein
VDARADRILEVRAMYWNSNHMGGGWAFVMTLGMLIFSTALVVAILWAVHSSRSSTMPGVGSQAPGAGSAGGDAQDILANRLARGDIDPDEYQARLDVLKSTGTR